MAFLTLNGIELPALVNSGERDDMEIGEGLSRAFDGSVQRSTRGHKRVWSLQSLADVPGVSQAFVALLQGRGHRWSFDTDLYSDLGLGPASASLTSIGSGGRWGNCMSFTSSSGSLSYAGLAGPSGFTLLAWHEDSGLWNDYELTWNGAGTLTNVYKNGAVQATTLPAFITSFTIATGTLVLASNASATSRAFDDMVAWPFEAPAAWLPQVYAFRNASPWSFGDSFTMGGGIGSATVKGKPGKSKLQSAVIDGVAYDAAESFPFDLWEG